MGRLVIYFVYFIHFFLLFQAKRDIKVIFDPFKIYPSPNLTIVRRLIDFRKAALKRIKYPLLFQDRNENTSFTKEVKTKHHQLQQTINCGIIWTLTSLNGSLTNYDTLRNVGKGVGFLRLKTVVYEVLASAARFRSALLGDPTMPKNCPNGIELVLFLDRDILYGLKDSYINRSISCVFDKVYYYDMFDGLPLGGEPYPHWNPLNGYLIDSSKHKKNTVDELLGFLSSIPPTSASLFSRLSPRPNAMKLLTLFISPYRYSLYLDGDTAPCPSFHLQTFPRLLTHDLFTTPNPFGFESSEGKASYAGGPNEANAKRLVNSHATHTPAHTRTKASTYANFPEVNGGVIGFRGGAWTARGSRSSEATGLDIDMDMQLIPLSPASSLFLRALELLSHYARLHGWDQDQVMVRHALFEAMSASLDRDIYGSGQMHLDGGRGNATSTENASNSARRGDTPTREDSHVKLKVRFEPMSRYCRFPFDNCEKNYCPSLRHPRREEERERGKREFRETGAGAGAGVRAGECVIIHQRKCVNQGVQIHLWPSLSKNTTVSTLALPSLIESYSTFSSSPVSSNFESILQQEQSPLSLLPRLSNPLPAISFSSHARTLTTTHTSKTSSSDHTTNENINSTKANNNNNKMCQNILQRISRQANMLYHASLHLSNEVGGSQRNRHKIMHSKGLA